MHTHRFEGADDRRRAAADDRRRASARARSSASPIVIFAHRDAAASGSRAELSGTAALLELARVFAARETKRTIVLVSTSGGSGGDAGAAEWARDASSGVAATAAGRGRSTRRSCSATSPARSQRRPFVVPVLRQLRLGAAAAAAHGRRRDHPRGRRRSRRAERARAVRPPRASRWPSANRACSTPTACRRCSSRSPANAGRRRVRAVSAAAPGGVRARGAQRRRRARHGAGRLARTADEPARCERQTLPAWAIALLVGTLLLPVLLATRRRARAAAPAAAAGRALDAVDAELRAAVLHVRGVRLPARPARDPRRGAVGAGARPARCRSTARPRAALVAVALTFVLAWALWGVLVRRLELGPAAGPGGRRGLDAAGRAAVIACSCGWSTRSPRCCCCPRCTCGWCSPRPSCARGRLGVAGARRAGAAAAGAARRLLRPPARPRRRGGSPGWAVLLLAGGHVGLLGAILWSVAFGCRRGGRDAGAGHRRAGAGREDADDRRGHDPRADVLRRAGLARWNRVGSATIGRACPDRDVASRTRPAPQRGVPQTVAPLAARAALRCSPCC